MNVRIASSLSLLLITAAMGIAAPSATTQESTGPGAASPRAIRIETVVQAPRPEVWRAWTTSEGARSFFAPEARIELRLDGPYEIYFVPDAPEGSRGSEGCRILSYLHEEMVSFTWNAPPQFAELRSERTFVVVRLADAGVGATRVTLTHGGWRDGEEWDAVFAYFDKAWPFVLGNLEKRFAKTNEKPDAAAGAQANQHFVYFLSPCRPDVFENMTDEQREAMAGHVEHIRRLTAEGTVILAGPCTEPTRYPAASEKSIRLEMPVPGIVVFEAPSLDEAVRVMEADPAVAAGLFKARLNAFRLAFMRK